MSNTGIRFASAEHIRIPDALRKCLVRSFANVFAAAGPDKLQQLSERPEEFAESFVALAESTIEGFFSSSVASAVGDSINALAKRLRIPTPT